MVETMRLRVGSDVTHFPETEDKAALAYVDLVRTKRVKVDGVWQDGEAEWFKASLTGGYADAMQDYQKGDNLIVVVGKTREVEREHEGQTYRDTRLFVDSFGPDPLLSRITIDRSRKSDHSQDAAQSPSQSVSDDAEAELSAQFQHDRDSRLVLVEADHDRLLEIESRVEWLDNYVAEVSEDADLPQQASTYREEATALRTEADAIARKYGFENVERLFEHGDKHGVTLSDASNNAVRSTAETAPIVAEADVARNANFVREQSAAHEYGGPDPSKALALFNARAEELYSASRVKTPALQELTSIEPGNSPSEWADNVEKACRDLRLPDTESQYLVSVAREAAGTGHVMTWKEAEAAAGATPSADPWDTVKEIRQDLATDPATAPSQ